MLVIDKLSITHRLHDISVAQLCGKVVHLVGQNGAGKSSLLAAIAGVLQVESGEIEFNQCSLNTMDEARFSLFRAFLEQQHDTPFQLPVKHVLRYFSQGRYQGNNQALVTSDVIPASINDAAEISDLLNRSITQLSGGERQRVHIARSLLKAWPVLEKGNGLVLLDEPFQGLDYRHQQLLCELLSRLANNGNCVLVSVHDVNLSVSFADDVWLMHQGRLVLAGDKQDVLTQANLAQYWDVGLQCVSSDDGRGYFYLDQSSKKKI